MAEASPTKAAAVSRIERVTGGTLAPIETGNKPYGGGKQVGGRVSPKATNPNRRYNPNDQRPTGGTTAKMARGGKGWSAPKTSGTPRYTAPKYKSPYYKNRQFGPGVKSGSGVANIGGDNYPVQ